MKSLTHKKRFLLKVVESLSEKGRASKFMLIKSLFLLAHEENVGSYIKFYNFFPYKYGPFSNVCYTDLHSLEKEGYLIEKDSQLALTENGKQAASTANLKASFKIKWIINKFNSNNEIREYVYSNYPEYTVKSELIPKTEKRYSSGLFTIGYEGKDIDSFHNILITNMIDVIIDVRKNPFSMNFSFTRKKLENYLKKVDIQYIHTPELGIDGKLRDNLSTQEDYLKLFKQYKSTTLKEQKDQIEIVKKLSQKHRVALLCFEKDENMCHRGIIAEDIQHQGVEVTHL